MATQSLSSHQYAIAVASSASAAAATPSSPPRLSIPTVSLPFQISIPTVPISGLRPLPASPSDPQPSVTSPERSEASPIHPDTAESCLLSAETETEKKTKQDEEDELFKKLESQMDDEILNSLSSYEKMISSSPPISSEPETTQISVRETVLPDVCDQDEEENAPRARRNTTVLRQELASIEAELVVKKSQRISHMHDEKKDESTTKKLKKKLSTLHSPKLSRTSSKRAKSNSTNDPTYLLSVSSSDLMTSPRNED